jgi:hypothetical protein
MRARSRVPWGSLRAAAHGALARLFACLIGFSCAIPAHAAAQEAAAESSLDPNVWVGNVEHAAAGIVGRETVQYVSNIYKYYVAYRLATERSQEPRKARETVAPTP